MLSLIVGGLILLLAVLLLLRLHRTASGNSSNCRPLPSPKRVLLVTAHPDDEAMFFGPTILGLLNQGADLYLLCLSSGNYRNQGDIRKAELIAACRLLGITSANIVVVEHTKLPDNPSKAWPRSLVSEIVLGWVERLSAETIVTFDMGGVSGHRNHIAVSRALQGLQTQGRLPAGTAVFVLDTVWLLRKYSGLLDLAWSLQSAPFAYVSDWSGLRVVWRAMRHGHRSQMLWFRYLYLAFSRYTVINTLRRISAEALSIPSSSASSPSSKTKSPDSSNNPSPLRRPFVPRAAEA